MGRRGAHLAAWQQWLASIGLSAALQPYAGAWGRRRVRMLLFGFGGRVALKDSIEANIWEISGGRQL